MARVPENLSHYVMMSTNKPGLDTDPAAGTVQRMKIVAQHAAGINNKTHSETESPTALYDKFLHVYLRVAKQLDAAMLGDSSQKVGAFFFGEGGGGSKESTAAKPTKDAIYLNSAAGDLKELFDLFDLLTLSLADNIPGNMNASMAAKKQEMFKTLESADASDLLELREKLEDIKDAFDEAQKRAEKQSAIPLKYSVLGKRNGQFGFLRYRTYYMKANNGQGLFAVQYQYPAVTGRKPPIDDPSWYQFKIFTMDDRLYSLGIISISNSDEIITKYFQGFIYEYVGDERFRSLVPYP